MRVRKGVAGLIAAAAIASGGAVAVQAQNAATQSAAPVKPALSRDILHVQAILDQLGFPPGPLDGREGQGLTAALKAFQITRQIPVTGKTGRI